MKKIFLISAIVFMVFITQSCFGIYEDYRTVYYKDGRLAAIYSNGKMIERHTYTDSSETTETSSGKNVINYNEDGTLAGVSETFDFLEHSESYTYDESGDQTSAVIAYGEANEKYEYNSEGLVSKYSYIDEFGMEYTEEYLYGDYGRVIQINDNLGTTRVFGYDGKGDIVYEIINGQFVYDRTYDEEGLLTEISFSYNNPTSFFQYLIRSKVDFKYDSVCFDAECTERTNVFKGISDSGFYGGWNLINEYDDIGLTTKQKIVNPEPDPEGTIEYTYEYNDDGDMVKAYEDGEMVFEYVYDEDGMLAQEISGEGYSNSYIYENGNVVEVVYDPDSSIQGGEYSQKIFYDASGNERKYIETVANDENLFRIGYVQSPYNLDSIFWTECLKNDETNPDNDCDGNIDFKELTKFANVFGEGKVTKEQFEEAKEKWRETFSTT